MSETIGRARRSQSEVCASPGVPSKSPGRPSESPAGPSNSPVRPSESFGNRRVQVARIVESRCGASGPRNMGSETLRPASVSLFVPRGSLGVARVTLRGARRSIEACRGSFATARDAVCVPTTHDTQASSLPPACAPPIAAGAPRRAHLPEPRERRYRSVNDKRLRHAPHGHRIRVGFAGDHQVGER